MTPAKPNKRRTGKPVGAPPARPDGIARQRQAMIRLTDDEFAAWSAAAAADGRTLSNWVRWQIERLLARGK